MGKVSQKATKGQLYSHRSSRKESQRKRKEKNTTVELKEVPEEFNHKNLRQTIEKGATIVNEYYREGC